MEQYFVRDYTGGSFILFGAWHMGFIGFFILFNLLIILSRKRLDLLGRKKFRYGLAISSIVVESSWHIWSAVVGLWNVQEYLPLHLCSVFVILNSIMLFTRSYRIYEFSYFLGIAGALQAFLTPDAGIYGLPHFRAAQTLLAHGLLITEGLYMTIVEGFRPTWGSIKRVMIGANIYMAFVGLVNWLLGQQLHVHRSQTCDGIFVGCAGSLAMVHSKPGGGWFGNVPGSIHSIYPDGCISKRSRNLFRLADKL